MSRNFGSTSELDSQVKSHIEYNIVSKTIFVISKIKCRACVEAKALLNKLSSKTGVKPVVLDLDNFPKLLVKPIINWLSTKTGIKTVPQIFINGKFVGGNDDVQRLHWNGILLSLVGMKTGRSEVTKAGSKQIAQRTSTRVLPIKVEVSPKPIAMNYNSVSDNFNSSSNASSRRKSMPALSRRSPIPSLLSRSAMSYRPGTFVIDDDDKWDMMPEKLSLRKA